VACGHPAEDEIRYLFWKWAIKKNTNKMTGTITKITKRIVSMSTRSSSQGRNSHAVKLPPMNSPVIISSQPGNDCQCIIVSVGLTGLEPVTLRLSSACSNQLSYRPWILAWRKLRWDRAGCLTLTYCRPQDRSPGDKGIRTPDL
jgi:hypothetical protein